MTYRNNLRLQMLRRVGVFGAKYQAKLAPVALDMLPVIAANADQLLRLGGAEVEAETTSKGGTKDRAGAFTALRGALKKIHDTAQSIDRRDGLPDIGNDFLWPLPDKQLKTAIVFGETYIRNATPHIAHFVYFGMKPDFLTKLQAEIDEAKGAETAQDEGDLAHGGTVQAQNSLADASVKLVRDLGTSVDNTFDSGTPEDEMILREWESASLIEVRNVSPKAAVVPV
ncbi:MAG TPA: hypothetical protein VF627_06735 [Abditibacterium sp.]|jgi:hypothetical protein